MKYLTFAIAKGRLAALTTELFIKAGICAPQQDDNSRKLVIENEDNGFRFFLAKADDVPVYIEYGAADIGICGKDTLLEANRNLYELLDLEMGACRMVVASRKENEELLHCGNNFRVATKYPRIAASYFAGRKQTVQIVRLGGSVELAPIVGLADFIVDLVETGTTLDANGLVVLDTIMPITARLAVNRASLKTEHERVTSLIGKLKDVL